MTCVRQGMAMVSPTEMVTVSVGTEKTYFIGTENQYAPVGPTAFEGCDYFDPEANEFGVVTVPEQEFSDFDLRETEISIRENGAADITVESSAWGSGVGGFRRKWDEMLPEERQRRYQAILGGIAQAASGLLGKLG